MKQEKENKNKQGKGVGNVIEVVRIFKVENNRDSAIKAFVDIQVCNAVLIKGIRVLGKKDGSLLAVMPTQQGNDGKYYQTVKLLAPEANDELQRVVLAAYQA